MKVNELSVAIRENLNSAAQEKTDKLKKIVDEVTDYGLQEIRKRSTKSKRNRKKKYYKDWKKKTVFENKSEKRNKLYNDQFQLTFLLERGHAIRGGSGRTTKPQPHIKPTEELIIKKLIEEVKKI